MPHFVEVQADRDDAYLKQHFLPSVPGRDVSFPPSGTLSNILEWNLTLEVSEPSEMLQRNPIGVWWQPFRLLMAPRMVRRAKSG